VIKSVRKAKKISVNQVKITMPYNLYQVISHKILSNPNNPVIVENEAFTDQVEIIVSVPVANQDLFDSAIRDLSNGKITPKIIAENQIKLIPH
jgi:hypothetical protein